MGKSKSSGDVIASSVIEVSKAEKKSSKKSSSHSKHKSSVDESSPSRDELAGGEDDEQAIVSPVKTKKSKKSKKSEDAQPVDGEEPSRKVSTSVGEEDTPKKKDKKKRSKKAEEEAKEEDAAEEPSAPPAEESDDEIIIHKRGAADSNFNNSSPAKKSNVGSGGGGTPRGESTSIFVRGLVFGITADQVRDHFADCGEVVSVRFVSNDHGQCFVDFATVAAAAAACKKDGEQGPGDTDRYCNIREHTFGKWFNECAVFVEADASAEAALREQMGYYGEIVDLQFHESGALVVYGCAKEAEAAIEGGKINLGSNYSVWVKMAMFKEQYGLGQSPRDFNGSRGRGGGRGGSSRGGGRGGRGGRGAPRGGRGGNRF